MKVSLQFSNGKEYEFPMFSVPFVKEVNRICRIANGTDGNIVQQIVINELD